jgi:hypothetical protein
MMALFSVLSHADQAENPYRGCAIFMEALINEKPTELYVPYLELSEVLPRFKQWKGMSASEDSFVWYRINELKSEQFISLFHGVDPVTHVIRWSPDFGEPHIFAGFTGKRYPLMNPAGYARLGHLPWDAARRSVRVWGHFNGSQGRNEDQLMEYTASRGGFTPAELSWFELGYPGPHDTSRRAPISVIEGRAEK